MDRKLYESEAFKFCPVCAGEFINKSVIEKECSACGYVYFIAAKPSSGAIIVDRTGSVLLVQRKRNPYKGTLDVPAGFADFRENFEEALARELKEEVGLDLTRCKYRYWKSFVGEYEFKGVTKLFSTAMFVVEVSDSHKKELKAGDDAASFKFVSLNELDFDEIGFPEVKGLLNSYLAYSSKISLG